MALLKLFFWCFCVPSSIFLVYHLLTRKYLNPYKMYMVFGKKGSGKSTLLTKLALKYIKQGRPVYTTESIPGTYQISPNDIGYVYFPPGSVFLIDEAGMIWDSRDFKKFDPAVRDWTKLLRHTKCTAWLFSQTFDVDKKLRDTCDAMYLVENKFRVFSYAKKISKMIVLTESTSEGESRVAENLTFEPFIFFMFGTRKLTFIPKYAKLFDSFTPPCNLRKKEYTLTEGVSKLCTPNKKVILFNRKSRAKRFD